MEYMILNELARSRAGITSQNDTAKEALGQAVVDGTRMNALLRPEVYGGGHGEAPDDVSPSENEPTEVAEEVEVDGLGYRRRLPMKDVGNGQKTH